MRRSSACSRVRSTRWRRSSSARSPSCSSANDSRTGELTFASAGHSPLLVWRRDGRKLESHRATGIPLGAVRGGAIARTLRNDVVKLGPGDAIVQFTDGVNEAFEPTGTEQFGMD